MPTAYINGTDLYYEKRGDGFPIIFIHPPLLTSANFRYQQVQLAGQFTVITFDIRGHGRSGASEAPVTYDLIVEDMLRLLDHLSIPEAYVCGYSTGGSIALEAMLTHPDRFTGGILVSAMSEVSDYMLRNRIRVAVGMSSWKPLIRVLMWGITWGNADGRLTFRNLLRDARRGNPANIHQYYKFSLTYSCTDRLVGLRAPVLLLYGNKDGYFTQYRKKIQSMLPHYDLHILENEKHQIPTKAASEMNEVIGKWIRGLLRPRENTVIGRSAEPEAGMVTPPYAAIPEVPAEQQPEA